MSDASSTPPRSPRRTVALTATVGLALALVVGPAALGGRGAAAAPLAPFAGCDELADWFAASAYAELARGWTFARSGGDENAAVDSAASASVGPGATGTNVQEAGVDEPDVLKTDGSRLVAVHDDQLSVVDVSGNSARVLGRLRLPLGRAAELLLVGDRALVFGAHDAQPPTGEDQRLPNNYSPTVVLTVVDLAHPTAPAVLRTEEIEGGYLSARETDGVVRIVLTSTPYLPYVWPDNRTNPIEASAQNRRLVDAAAAQDWLPQRIVRDAGGRILSTEPLLACDQVNHPTQPAGLGVLSVLTMDLAAPAAPLSDPVAVAASGDLVYASPGRLYVATTRGGWSGPAVDLAVSPGSTVTELHGFALDGRDSVRYLATGQVDGWLLGRWALSAQDGYLRVATTRDADSAVTVLAERGDRLEIVGSVTGLGPGEQIRSVRWFGDMATVVTFQQTDPLYTVDLSDPTAPRVRGELKVTGYSGYLHPLGDGLLLGVGQQATSQGEVTGALVSAFDIRDLDRPSLLSTVEEPEAWSEVEGDSRAFIYLPERRLAVTPVSGQRGSMLWAVSVGRTGVLATAGQWSAGTDWLIRAIPLGNGRLAALTVGADSGADVTVLRLADLIPVDEISLS